MTEAHRGGQFIRGIESCLARDLQELIGLEGLCRRQSVATQFRLQQAAPDFNAACLLFGFDPMLDLGLGSGRANVSSAIAGCHANISRAEIITREDRKAELDFVVEITDTAHLNRVLKAIERVDGVITTRRIRSWQEKS